MKARLQKLLAEYGKVALYTYLTLSLLAIAGFSVAIGLGFGAESATSVIGTIGAGWLAAKATMPLRILATLALTPLVASLVRRLTKDKADSDDEADEEPAQENVGK
jgi:membrane protein implicated in regulation of membrane protease activity